MGGAWRKRWWRWRQWRAVAWRDFKSPLVDRFALWAALQIPANLVLVYYLGGLDRMLAEWPAQSIIAGAFAVTLPVWYLINFFRAPWVIQKEEKALGQWHGDRFVFHEPIRVGTFILEPAPELREWTFSLPYCESLCLVGCEVKFTGKRERIKILLSSRPADRIVDIEKMPFGSVFGSVSFVTQKKPTVTVVAQSLERTDMMTVGVYMTYWQWQS